MDESAKQSCYNYLLWVLESGALAAYTSSPLPPVMLCVPSLFFRAHHTLLFTRPAFCVWERVWVWISSLIISDRDVTGVWQSSICHNWHLYPITFLVFFFLWNLPNAGICGVSSRIRCSGLGIQRIQTRPQQLRQVERRKSYLHKQYRRKGEEKTLLERKRERNELLLRAL